MNIPKEDMYRICVAENYSRANAAKYFCVSENVIAKHLKEYGLNKFQEKKVDKDELFDYYITKKHTLEETCKYFNLSKTCLCGKLKKYHIKKSICDVTKKDRKIYIDKEKAINFYIDSNMTLSETARKLGCSYKVLIRRLQEYGIKKDTKKRYENVSESCLKNNGVKSPAQVQEIKEKMAKTNMERYGVPYACMREEYHRFKGSDSQFNLNFEKKLQSLGIEYEREFALDKYLYDFKVGNKLIELDPTVTHNSTKGIYNSEPKDKSYHLLKSKVARDNDFHCIHIFEWDNEDKIIDLFLKQKEKVFARNCVVKEVSKETANEFLNVNHLQGSSRGNILNIGLFNDEELVELMTFGKPRYNKEHKWELLRLCSSKSVIGGSEKILNYFEKAYSPKSLISYCDISKFSGEVYKKLGFELLRESKPRKHWCYFGNGKRQHITDNFLREHGFDQLFGTSYGKGTSNEELMLKNNYVIVYDCGQATYIKYFR